MTESALQELFSEPLVDQAYLDPGYSGHANDVWRVRTATEDVVVRIARGADSGNPFWDGCRQLFGIDPTRIDDLGPLNALLASISSIPVPTVLRSGRCGGRQAVVVERMPGRGLQSFDELSNAALEALGRSLAGMHARTFPYYGSPIAGIRHPVSAFPRHLADVMHQLVSRHYRDDHAISAACEAARMSAAGLPAPPACALIMVDIDPSQFLSDGERITALVDTDAYVIGPRELDFIGLEYVCNQRSAAAIARGYGSLLPLPDLCTVRPVYRYLYRLLEVQGTADLDDWMRRPIVFA